MSTTQTCSPVMHCSRLIWYCMLLFYGWLVSLQVVGLTCIRTVAAVFRLMRYRWLVRSIVSLNGECVYWPYVHLQAAYTINVVKPLGCRWRIARACAWPTPYIAVGYASLIKAACDTQRLNNFRHCTVASVAAWNIYECYYMVLYSHVVDVRYDVGHIRSIPRFALVFAKGAFSMRYIG